MISNLDVLYGLNAILYKNGAYRPETPARVVESSVKLLDGFHPDTAKRKLGVTVAADHYGYVSCCVVAFEGSPPHVNAWFSPYRGEGKGDFSPVVIGGSVLKGGSAKAEAVRKFLTKVAKQRGPEGLLWP